MASERREMEKEIIRLKPDGYLTVRVIINTWFNGWEKECRKIIQNNGLLWNKNIFFTYIKKVEDETRLLRTGEYNEYLALHDLYSSIYGKVLDKNARDGFFSFKIDVADFVAYYREQIK